MGRMFGFYTWPLKQSGLKLHRLEFIWEIEE
jgi:hypothetical protein